MDPTQALAEGNTPDLNAPGNPVVMTAARMARDIVRKAVVAGVADPADIEGFDELDAEAERAEARRAGGW